MDELTALAGAVLCVGVPGDSLALEDGEALASLAPGGVALFARNVSSLEATRALVRDIRAAAGGDAPALVCVDQEGGRVVRLRFASDALPSMLALGATHDAGLARRTGAWLAAELRAVGANVAFAPVLDLALPGATTVIGTRALGGEPADVARLGVELVIGLQDAGVAATPKHFPGHGATALDSHLALPALDADEALLQGRELVPFRAAFAAGARAVMAAHVVVRALDPERPASLSPRVLQTLLRDDLGFAGVCFTDCLTMEAIAAGPGVERGAVAALAAGADVVTISRDLALARGARDAIVSAAQSGELPLHRLREAAQRVARLRAWAAPAAACGDGPAGGLPLEIACRAIGGARSGRLDLERPVTVISFEGAASDGIAYGAAERPSLSLALRRRRVRSESMRVALEPSDETIEALLEIVRAQGARQFVVLARRADRYPPQQRALHAIFSAAPQTIAVSMLEPFDASLLGAAHAVLLAHGDEEINVAALASVLTGRDGAT